MEVAQLVIGRLDVPPSWKFAAFVCSRRLHAGSDSPAVAVTSNLSGTKSGARVAAQRVRPELDAHRAPVSFELDRFPHVFAVDQDERGRAALEVGDEPYAHPVAIRQRRVDAGGGHLPRADGRPAVVGRRHLIGQCGVASLRDPHGERRAERPDVGGRKRHERGDVTREPRREADRELDLERAR